MNTDSLVEVIVSAIQGAHPIVSNNDLTRSFNAQARRHTETIIAAQLLTGKRGLTYDLACAEIIELGTSAAEKIAAQTRLADCHDPIETINLTNEDIDDLANGATINVPCPNCGSDETIYGVDFSVGTIEALKHGQTVTVPLYEGTEFKLG